MSTNEDMTESPVVTLETEQIESQLESASVLHIGELPITSKSDPVSYTRSILSSNNIRNNSIENGQEDVQLDCAMDTDLSESSMAFSVVDSCADSANIVMELVDEVDLHQGTDIQFFVIETEDTEQLLTASGESYQILSHEFDEPTAETNQQYLELEQITEVQAEEMENCDCDICNKILVGPFSQFRHMRCQNISEDLLWCLYCPFGAEMQSDLNRHMAVEHGLDQDGQRLKNIPCPDPDCLFICVTTTEMADHLENLHLYRSRCDLCNASFFSKSYLTYHKATVHCKESEFSCNLCDFKTTLKVKLKFHLQAHEENVRCAVCSALVTFANMESHQKSHNSFDNNTNDKCADYNCSLCSFKTKIPYALQFHLRTIHKLTSSEISFLDEVFRK
ncbi:hypothetical protein CHUAL_012389 [Chamberlinius hualienensis]